MTLSRDEVTEYLNDLQTPEGIWDVPKLIVKVDFPFYIISNETLQFLINAHEFSMGKRVDSNIYIREIPLTYIIPSYINHNQTVMISNFKPESGPILSYYPLSLLSRMSRCLPERFKPPFDWGDFKDMWAGAFTNDLYRLDRVRKYLEQIDWEKYATAGLQFNVFHQNEPGPFSLAYSQGNDWCVLVGSVGMSRYEFLSTLASLVCLRENEDMIDEFQVQLRIGGEESKRYREQKSKKG